MTGINHMDKAAQPDNTLTMEINGTNYTIHEYFGGKETLNDIIAKRVASDLDTPCSKAENP